MGRVLQSPAPRRAPSKTLHPPVLQKKTMFPELFYVGQASNSALPCQACLCLQHEQCGIWWSRTELCGRYDLTGNALPPSSLLIPLWLQAGKRGQARQTQPLQGAVLQRKAHPPQKSVTSSCSSQLQNNKIVKNPIIRTSILAGTAAGNLIAQRVPVKDGMCSSWLFLILIRMKSTASSRLANRGLSRGQEEMGMTQASLPQPRAFPSSPQHRLGLELCTDFEHQLSSFFGMSEGQMFFI